jgi:pyruvate dehydrogenase E2 component (dihydrolipoamide acetyltransferase)
MPIILVMPALSPTMSKGNLVTWSKVEGDLIEIGDVLAEIDTDKATMEIESTSRGILAKILVPAGSKNVLVKTPIAIIRQDDETDEDVQQLLKSTQCQPVIHTSPLDSSAACKSEPRASPLAKRIANLSGISLQGINGTGPHGRIVKADVLAASANQATVVPSERAFVDSPLSGTNSFIANKLTKTKNECPHFYMSASADVTNIFESRTKLNNELNFKLTFTDFVIKAVALAMIKNPDINVSCLKGNTIRKFNSVDISVAVATEFCLYTPVIFDADKKDLTTISNELKGLVGIAKAGELSGHQCDGGSITISNLGMFAIDSFFSIINSPQASILSIGPALKTPIFDDNDNLSKAMIVKIGYAIDHRVIDGQAAARFLVDLKHFLSNPVLLTIDSRARK